MEGKNGGTLNPFEKGKSGNPKGKPVGTKNRSTVIKELLEFATKQKNVITGEEQTLTQEQAMTLAMMLKATNGDVNAYKALMDSAYGAPKQTTDTNLSVTDFDVKDLFKIDSLK